MSLPRISWSIAARRSNRLWTQRACRVAFCDHRCRNRERSVGEYPSDSPPDRREGNL